MIVIGKYIFFVGILAGFIVLAITEASNDQKFNKTQTKHTVSGAPPQGKYLKHKKYQPLSDKKPRNDFQERKIVPSNPGDRVRRSTNEIGETILVKGQSEKFGKKLEISNKKSSELSNSLAKWSGGIQNFKKHTAKRSDRQRYHLDRLFEDSRRKRAVFVSLPRANISDYYVQRKAIMEKFYARQRQIANKYAKHESTIPTSTSKSGIHVTTENNSISSFKVEEEDVHEEKQLVNTTNNIVNATDYTSTTELTTGLNVVDALNHEEIVDNSENTSNVVRDSPNYYDYSSNEDDYTDDGSVLNEKETVADQNDILLWGTCMGKLIYQHNLLLTVHGSTIRDGNFVVELSGPICVTCVKVVPFRETRATMSLVSIHKDQTTNYVKLKLKGFQGDSFAYIVKIWAVRKSNNNCEDIE